jgi:hypothetical protein
MPVAAESARDDRDVRRKMLHPAAHIAVAFVVETVPRVFPRQSFNPDRILRVT